MTEPHLGANINAFEELRCVSPAASRCAAQHSQQGARELQKSGRWAQGRNKLGPGVRGWRGRVGGVGRNSQEASRDASRPPPSPLWVVPLTREAESLQGMSEFQGWVQRGKVPAPAVGLPVRPCQCGRFFAPLIPAGALSFQDTPFSGKRGSAGAGAWALLAQQAEAVPWAGSGCSPSGPSHPGGCPRRRGTARSCGLGLRAIPGSCPSAALAGCRLGIGPFPFPHLV